MSTSTTMDSEGATPPGGQEQDRARRVASAAVSRAAGGRVSPALEQAATEAVSPWAERMVRWLDDFIRIPGTNLRIGLDPVLGFLIPGAGDAVTGTGSMSLLLLALKERVPTVVLLRMCLNILVDTIGGLLPFLGDAFDLVWRSNRRNLDLIERYRRDDEGQRPDPSWVDYALVGAGIILAIASIVVPILIIYGLGFGVVAGLLEIGSS